MIFNRYDKIQQLKSGKYYWRIRVRAQAVWKGINRQTQEFRGLNVIFIDDSKFRIHAFVSAKIVDLFDKDLKEGRIFTVSNFHVRDYGGDEMNRAVRFEKHIYFANYTKLIVEPENLTNIAPFAFDLFDLHDVDKFLTDTRFLIDVVGIIKDKSVSCVFSLEDKSRSHIKFKITDGRSVLNVTFFNEMAVEFEKALKENIEEQIFIIIACAKVNQHEGQLYKEFLIIRGKTGATCLNNYPATRFYLNVDHYSVTLLKKRALENTVPIEIMEAEEENIPELLSIAEIKKLNKEYIERKVRCMITVKKVDEKSNWYDNICTSCENEVNTVEGRYKCDACNRNIPYPDKRFRLATVCNDKTGILAIVFPDDEIQRITGRNVFEIENDDNQVGEGISFPPLLKSFEKKEYIVTLKLDDKNINKSCNIYAATELNNPVESLGNHSPTKNQTVSNKENSMSMEIDINQSSIQSPPTVQSSTKIRARPGSEKIPYEMDENVVLSKLKFIKTEKL